MKYHKETFDPLNLAHAKDIVLVPDPTRPHKFAEETDHLVEFMIKNVPLIQSSIVLDFGCGMGRVAKRLIERVGCKVIGVDISAGMLHEAQKYVSDGRFNPKFNHHEQNIDIALAAFALQHAEKPEEEIKKINSVLKPGGTVVLLNEPARYVPTEPKNGMAVWHDDGIKVSDLMTKHFSLVGYYPYLGNHNQILSLWKKG
ncbi:class I SAM-dependent methyltransferase [Candidatus Nomurabacteria bacterium]|nr:class I SAM-dependent methyltransferase [Candidatus Nomurabacteria bacterium]